MKLMQLLILVFVIISINAKYIPIKQQAFYDIEFGTCIDCFDRKFQQGSMYWEGCDFCKCDETLSWEERCKSMDCFFSPCPKLRAMMKKTNTHHKGTSNNNWTKWTFGRK